MDIGSWLSVTAGITLVVIVLADIWFMTLHPDSDGPLSSRMRRFIWRLLIALAARHHGMRRSFLAMAGPVMLAVNFVFWLSFYMLGFALIYWPFMDGFSAKQELLPLSFVDALYYSAITGTVLGYGDITPVQTFPKVMSFVQSGLGFAIVTLAVTYLINVLSSISERDALAVSLSEKTFNTQQGRRYIIRYMATEGARMLLRRLKDLTEQFELLQEKMHHFPFIDLYYRSKEPSHDPEPMLQNLLEVAITARIVALSKSGQILGAAAEDLSNAVEHTMNLITGSHFDDMGKKSIADYKPGEADTAYIKDLKGELSESLGLVFRQTTAEEDEILLRQAYKARVFMDGLQRVTYWHIDHSRQ